MDDSPMSNVPVVETQQKMTHAVHESIMENVDKIDLFDIMQRLCEPEEVGGKNWSEETAKDAVALYREFLALCMLCSSEALVPTKVIDEVWYQHILDTRKYEEDCYAVFGRMLHHYPDYRPSASASLRDTRFTRTRELFMKEFGHDLRSDSALCSACYCDKD